MEDYRRETKILFEQNNLDETTIAQVCNVSVSTVYNWKSGRRSPTRKNLEKLKALAEGQTLSPPMTQHPNQEVAKLEGRIDQLTVQVAQIQSNQGVITAKIEAINSSVTTVSSVVQKLVNVLESDPDVKKKLSALFATELERLKV